MFSRARAGFVMASDGFPCVRGDSLQSRWKVLSQEFVAISGLAHARDHLGAGTRIGRSSNSCVARCSTDRVEEGPVVIEAGGRSASICESWCASISGTGTRRFAGGRSHVDVEGGHGVFAVHSPPISLAVEQVSRRNGCH